MKTLTREQYAEKFYNLFSKICWTPQKDEKIIQCKEPYPDYWFISNMGYLFSVYHKNIKILKPNFRTTGFKDEDGERWGRDWYYVTNYNNIGKISHHRIIAEHFLNKEFNSDDTTEIHHIRKRLSFTANQPQFCNRATNLQILPVPVHRQATKYGRKADTERTKELNDKIVKANAPIILVTQEQLLQHLLNGLQPNATATVYTPSLSNDISNIEVSAHPIEDVKNNFEILDD